MLAKSEERRILAALCVSAFLATLNLFAPTPFYPQMARDLHTTVPLLGQVVTVMLLISAVVGLLVGPLADHYGYRWPLVGGLLAITVTLLGSSLAPSYPVLLMVSIAGGLGDALVFALPLAIAGAFFSGAARRRAIGLTIASLSIAPIIGAPILTAISSVSGWRVALGSAALAGGAAALFVAFALPPDGRRPARSLRLAGIAAAYAPLLRHGASLRLFGVSALRGTWWNAVLTYLGAFLGTVIGLDTTQVGLVYALSGAAYAAASLLTGRLPGLTSRLAVGIACVLAGLLMVPLLAAGQASVVLPLLLIVAVAAAVSGVSVPTLLAAESPAGAGATMVLSGSALNLGSAGGAAVGGVLIGTGGFAALGVGLLIVALATAALACWPDTRR